jgi:hypothetical protein
MTTLIILTAVVGAALTRAGGSLLVGREPARAARPPLPSLRRISTL